MASDMVRNNFRKFGKRMFGLGVCTILLFIPLANLVALVLIIVYIFLILGDVKRANAELQQKNLKNFRIFIILGILAMILFMGVLFYVLLLVFFSPETLEEMAQGYMDAQGDTTVYVAVDIVISGIVQPFYMLVMVCEMVAWLNLFKFFKENELFSERAWAKAKSGSNVLKIAVMINLLVALISYPWSLITLDFSYLYFSRLMTYVGVFIGIITLIMRIVVLFLVGRLRKL
jgi:hypothetical protein